MTNDSKVLDLSCSAGDSEGKRGPGEHAWTQLQTMILVRNRAISMNCLKRRLQFACAAAI